MNPDQAQLRLTFIMAIVGIVAVILAFLISVLAFRNASQPGQIIPAVLGAVTTAIGTLAGLVTGHTAGAAGKESAEQRAQSNEHDATAGRALATVLKTEGAEAAGGLEGVTAAPQSAEAMLRRHSDLAKSLFP